MRGISLAAGSGGGWGPHHWRRLQQQRDVRRHASAASSNGRPPYWERVKGLQGPLKAGLTSGSLSAVGDLLAQFLTWQSAQSSGKSFSYDPLRTLRMFGYGLCWYGPCQFYWYNWLEWMMPLKNTPNFISKVAMNQLMLGPVTLSTVFAWNLTLTGKADQIAEKIRNDLFPTIQNGWKFWVPAASINFYCIPLQYQVLYMSACGVLWTAYLSYASSTAITQPAAAAAIKAK